MLNILVRVYTMRHNLLNKIDFFFFSVNLRLFGTVMYNRETKVLC